MGWVILILVIAMVVTPALEDHALYNRKPTKKDLERYAAWSDAYAIELEATRLQSLGLHNEAAEVSRKNRR